MKVHALKIWPDYFDAVASNIKTFEVRKDDRKFAVGDTLLLREWNPKSESYTGRELVRSVSYVMHGMGNVGVIGPARGISLGFVVLALTDSREIARNVECAVDRTEPGVLGGQASQLSFL